MTADKPLHLVPQLRFPEFRHAPGWEPKTVDALARITQGGTPETSNADYWGGSVNWMTPAEMGKSDSPYIASTKRTLTEDGFKNCFSELLPPYSVIISIRAPIGHLAINTLPMAINQGCRGLIPVDDAHFLYNSLLHAKMRLLDLGAGNTFKELSGSALKGFILPAPSLAEQQKIADCLGSLDDLIAAEGRKLDALRQHKQGLMQQLFPQPGETVPQLRFPEFGNMPEWELTQLSDVLDYEQPGKYIVENASYQNSGTPVLTANKSFVLGHTAETDGIYQNVPVIIFDDFTTDAKYVDFPFKVKSSAIKILTSRGEDELQFVYELMSRIRFDPTQHKRYFISQYQYLKIPLPDKPEQQKIAGCLGSLDDLIAAEGRKLDALRQHKQGLMQQLFPALEGK